VLLNRDPERYSNDVGGVEADTFFTLTAAGIPAVRTRRPHDHRSRTPRWCDAVSEMTAQQGQYTAWLEAPPENLQDTATAEALQASRDLDLTELQATHPPRGVGRD